MTKVLVSEESLESIAYAIRQKNGETDQYRPDEMALAILDIPDPATLVTKSISANGTYAASSDEADGYSSVTVAVPNSYESSDEGKVVSSGALVAQTSTTKTANGTYDTTLNNEVVVNVPSGQADLGTKTITQNGTYSAEDDSLDGYSEVTVNVSGGGGGSSVPNLYVMPTGYQLLQYVEVTGSQYVTIDSGAAPYRLSMRVSLASSVGTAEAGFAGRYPVSSSALECYFSGGKLSVYRNGAYTIETIRNDGASSASAEVPYDVSLLVKTAYSSSSELLVGQYRTDRYPFSGRIYAASVYGASTTSASTAEYEPRIILVPCKRTSDGTAGLYDLISGEFMESESSADFVAGPNATVMWLVDGEAAVMPSDIADLVGTKTVTANGTYDAAGEDLIGYGQIDVSLPLGTKLVTENGSYSASSDGFAGYTLINVSVSGGGGGLSTISRADWEALTTAQKQVYGLIAIIVSETGYTRGVLVNGADYSDCLIYDEGTEIVGINVSSSSTVTKGSESISINAGSGNVRNYVITAEPVDLTDVDSILVTFEYKGTLYEEVEVDLSSYTGSRYVSFGYVSNTSYNVPYIGLSTSATSPTTIELASRTYVGVSQPLVLHSL